MQRSNNLIRTIYDAKPQTRNYYAVWGDYRISDDQIRAVIQRAFGVQDVVLLRAPDNSIDPNNRLIYRASNPLGFHLDQYAFFPSEGVAVMPSADFVVTAQNDPNFSRYRETLIAYRDQLQQAGFRIIEIPTDVEHIQNTQSYTNGLAITRENGRTHLILPSFPNSENLEIRIRTILENNGFEVEFSRNVTFPLKGNTHCLTGSFARKDDPPEDINFARLVPQRRVERQS